MRKILFRLHTFTDFLGVSKSTAIKHVWSFVGEVINHLIEHYNLIRLLYQINYWTVTVWVRVNYICMGF